MAFSEGYEEGNLKYYIKMVIITGLSVHVTLSSVLSEVLAVYAN